MVQVALPGYRFMIKGHSLMPPGEGERFFKSISHIEYDRYSYWVMEDRTDEHALCGQPKHGTHGIALRWDCIVSMAPGVFYSYGYKNGIQVYDWFETHEECLSAIQGLADVTSCCFCIYHNWGNHPALIDIMTGKHMGKWDRPRYLWRRIPACKRRRSGIELTAQAVIPTVFDPSKNPELSKMDSDFSEVWG